MKKIIFIAIVIGVFIYFFKPVEESVYFNNYGGEPVTDKLRSEKKKQSMLLEDKKEDEELCKKSRENKSWIEYKQQFPDGRCWFEAQEESERSLRSPRDLWHRDKDEKQMTWVQAEKYCSELEDGPWRLPNIDELRMRVKDEIRGDTEPVRIAAKGECKVSAAGGCLAEGCWTARTCGCDNKNTCPQYHFSKYNDDKGEYWSSSLVGSPDSSSNIKAKYWFIDFTTGTINFSGKRVGKKHVLCIRDNGGVSSD